MTAFSVGVWVAAIVVAAAVLATGVGLLDRAASIRNTWLSVFVFALTCAATGAVELIIVSVAVSLS